jgi:hypothetical protein
MLRLRCYPNSVPWSSDRTQVIQVEGPHVDAGRIMVRKEIADGHLARNISLRIIDHMRDCPVREQDFCLFRDAHSFHLREKPFVVPVGIEGLSLQQRAIRTRVYAA